MVSCLKFVCLEGIDVEKLKPESPPNETTSPNGTQDDSDSHDYCPNNYRTLWDFFRLIRNGITIVGI